MPAAPGSLKNLQTLITVVSSDLEVDEQLADRPEVGYNRALEHRGKSGHCLVLFGRLKADLAQVRVEGLA